MRILFRFCCSLLLSAGAALAETPVISFDTSHDIVLLGESHDNPAHHAVQARAVDQIAPRALVFEMLTARQAARVTDDNRNDPATLAQALGWTESGWPDFALYFPIFAAAPSARIYGAGVPRDAAREALKTGIVASFGDEAAAYGLTTPLPPGQQAEREALQMAAHCDALPEDLLPGMVDLQRLRDATLARAALRALDETGGPVVVITGNGHVRSDWGVPSVLARVRPSVDVLAVGQDEDGAIEGAFDTVLPGPAVDRGDPCAAFR